MKKVISIFCFALFFFAAQTASAQAEIDKGNVLLNAGVGFGYYYGGGGTSLALSAEWAINNFISIGPYLGISSSNYNYAGYGKYSVTFLDIGARGSYHFSQHLNLDTDKLDLYGGVGLGYVATSYSDEWAGYDPYSGGIRGSLFGGARWYFSDKFAVNGEVGFGYAPLLLGVTFKL